MKKMVGSDLVKYLVFLREPAVYFLKKSSDYPELL
jgi:hypothetical protein